MKQPKLANVRDVRDCNVIESTSFKTDTFGMGIECLCSRYVGLIESQIKEVKKDRDQLQVFALQRCLSYRVVR